MPITGFDGKTAFITGGAAGIGLGIAKVLVERGARVVLADLRSDHIVDALAEMAGGERSNAVSALQMDVTSREQYADAAERMERDFGGVDILVANAGVGLEGPILSATHADFDFGFGVNVGGVVNGFVAFMPQMIAHGRGGHMVVTSSMAAETVARPQMAIYGASKAAISHFSEAVQPVLAEHDIGVSILVPGLVQSRIHETQANRPPHLLAASGFRESEEKLSRRIVDPAWMDPVKVGHMVAEGILANDLYIVTHGNRKDAIRSRAAAVVAATPEPTPETMNAPPLRYRDPE